MRPTLSVIAASSLALLLTACPKENTTPMTQAEAKEAMEESTISSQASALTTASVDVSTSFTLGKGVANAAGEIKSFVQTQLPCAEITLAESTLTVKYGANPLQACKYKGQTFKGSHSIKVSKNEDNQVIVDHTWTGFTNNVVTVDGTAHVTWDFDDKYRQIEHDLTWKRNSDGRSGHDTGEMKQQPLAGGLKEGIKLDGRRGWEGQAGKWDLAVEDVQWRWADPVPQTGTFRLGSPKNRSLTLSFRRVDEDTIEVTLTNGTNSFKFNVNSIGAVADKA